MLLQLSERELRFLDRVREFVAREVRPNHRSWEAQGGWPDSLWSTLTELGLLTMVVPQELGGSGVSCGCYAEAVREVAKGDGALAMNIAALDALCAGHLVRFATPEQQALYLPKVVSGEWRMGWALTEPTAGSDARGVQTAAVPAPEDAYGPDRWYLTGTKLFITNAARAQLLVVFARIAEKELGAFLLETGQPGYQNEVRIETTGVKASYTTGFRLEKAIGWRTPGGFSEAIGLLQRGRIGIAAMALGLAEAALETAIPYSKEREQFGRPLAQNQAIQWMLADSATEIEAARLLIHKAARIYDEDGEALLAASQAKLFASEAASRVTHRMLQIFGGRGYTTEYDVEKYWRDARLCEIGEGSSEVQRIIISRELLR